MARKHLLDVQAECTGIRWKGISKRFSAFPGLGTECIVNAKDERSGLARNVITGRYAEDSGIIQAFVKRFIQRIRF